MNLTIVSYEPDALEAEAFGQACKKALQFVHCSEEDREVQIVVQPRKDNGWLEYYISVFDANHKLIIMIAMIQHTRSAEFEFHS